MNVIFLGATGNYPLDISASNSKNELIAKSLIASGCKVYVINSPLGSSKITSTLHKENEIGIKYYIFQKNRFIRNTKEIWEITRTLKGNKKKNIAILSLSYGRLPLLFLYILISKINRFKIALIINEWRIPPRWNSLTFFKIVKDIHELLKINLIPPFCDILLPISYFIDRKLNFVHKKSYILPALSDTDKIKPVKNTNNSFLYCGIGYFEVAIMVVKSFIEISENNSSELILVLNFGKDKKGKYQKEIMNIISKNKLQSRIKILSDIPYSELLYLYCNSYALLIPLDKNNLQDISRFPNKIGEYAASGRPIITMNVGDIGKYFKDDVSAFFVENYSISSLSLKMDLVFRNKEKANEVGKKGREVAENDLNYLKIGEKLYSVLETI